MAKDRLTLHSELKTILGSSNVYFQPPASLIMKYPCIIYKRDADEAIYADDIKYSVMKRYLVTVVDRDPDSLVPDKVSKLPYCKAQKPYTVDGLNHFVYVLYY